MQPEGSLKLKWCKNRISVANELCLLVPPGPNEPFEHVSPPARRPCSGLPSLRRAPPFPRQLGSSQRSGVQAEAEVKWMKFSFTQHTIYLCIYTWLHLHIDIVVTSLRTCAGLNLHVCILEVHSCNSAATRNEISQILTWNKLIREIWELVRKGV